MGKFGVVGWILLFLLFVAGCTGPEGSAEAEPVEVIVSAAASLTDAMREIGKQFEAGNPDVRLTFTFASSGTLQQQIGQGAPVDVFISAGEKQMQMLVEKDLVRKEKQFPLLSNTLVVITPPGEKRTFSGLADLTGNNIERIAVGIPETVPAGRYANEALDRHGLWDKLEPKMVLAKDVRQVLTYVETGNVDAGLVYRTDALVSGKVNIALTVDPESHRSIIYPAGLVESARHPAEAALFLAFLQGEEAAQRFEQYGFTVIGR